MIPQLGEDETEILEQVHHLILFMFFKLNFFPYDPGLVTTNKQSISNLVIDQWSPTPILG